MIVLAVKNDPTAPLASKCTTFNEVPHQLDPKYVENLAVATEIAALPLTVRGFGHVKARHAAEAKSSYQELRGILEEMSSSTSVAA